MQERRARSVAMLIMYFWRGMSLALGAAIIWWLTHRLGIATGLTIWSTAMAIACIGTAWLLQSSTIGKITWRNRLAGHILPWGLRLGKGKLIPVTIWAWIGWVLIGVAVIIATRTHQPSLPSPSTPVEPHRSHPVIGFFLFACWLVYGGMILRQLDFIFNQFTSHHSGRSTMIKLTLLMLMIIGPSVTLWWIDYPWLALAIAGLPFVLVGGFFAIYMGIFLIPGKNKRWN